MMRATVLVIRGDPTQITRLRGTDCTAIAKKNNPADFAGLLDIVNNGAVFSSLA
jgi:hypothetical protein